jgi:hypothetical protein
MAALEELGTHLQSLQALKPPGVTKSKIDSISKLCVDNVQVCRLAAVTVSDVFVPILRPSSHL